MIELYWDDATGQGISIRMMDEEDDEGLREVGERIAREKDEGPREKG